ncbi:MAG: indolepyruvate ferredoxin oxidoreductase family protein [Alphaproteobacteria bacterium]|nr:indolepyruvate ferredoxin oxidoreductase family protein [Alphaproteobacteria bacterium]
MSVAAVTLDDKYVVESGHVFLNGTQALVRLPLLQWARDAAIGLNTAGFVSGYRGSPLGGLDKELWHAKRFLESRDIRFQPGVNEDLAATAVWGTQQVGLFPGARHDGVFALWYGKGPGVDRSGDVFKHANMAGTSRHGGVLLLAGDDHGAKSSTVAHQSEYAFMDAQIPVLNPAGLQELIDYGLIGWAMSRYSGCWVAMKAISETVESSGTVDADPFRLTLVAPTDFDLPPGGPHIRWPDSPREQELRLMRHKIYAALAFARANRLDRTIIDSPEPRFGIVTTGKSYLDVRQALDDLGIDEAHAAEIGLRLYKVGMSWPLEREGVRHFAEGLDEILVVEEKRAVIENQLKEQLYNWREDVRPRVVGKFDEERNWVLPSAGELTPAGIARVIAARIDRFYTSPRIKERLAFLEAKERALSKATAALTRIPFYCAGCPHNTSTVVPEGSRGLAGIGCHYMVTWMDRDTQTFTHMGGEGASWIGQAPFTETPHVFQNLGDGTYYHSGLLAIRAAVAARVNITYKILFNDAVAMTGGQPVDGPLSVPLITQQLRGEGIERIAVVSDEPDKYPLGAGFVAGVTFHHRDDLDAVQRDLREWPGVSVLIYDQTCAAEKRRRRKRGKMPDPPKRVFINEAVCEGCGDCGEVSNCVAIAPVETEFGRKRMIDQSACNKDFSCLKGFCPSFVTVHGAAPRKRSGAKAGSETLPTPTLPAADHPWSIVVTGIGGTGVVTIGALLGMAAHLEGKGCSVLDMTGLAQKNGAVLTHLRIAHDPSRIHAVRIAAGGADLILGCDMVVAASGDALAKARGEVTQAVVNTHESMTAAFTHQPDLPFPVQDMRKAIEDTTTQAHFVDATALATELMGDSIATNMFMVGFAWQKGLIPLSEEAILKAIELNGAAVAFNAQAFAWGRRAAHDLAAVEAIATPRPPTALSRTLDELIERRAAQLEGWQDAAWAERYRADIGRVREAERRLGGEDLTKAAALALHKLMSYKDEYEVARLYTDGGFQKALAERFEDGGRLEFHLAPPLLARRDPSSGHLLKSSFGPWMMGAFRLLARLKGLRGTPFDPFGWTDERRMERGLIDEYRAALDEVLAGLTAANHALAVEIAALPSTMRGFGHVKAANVAKAKARERDLMARFRNPADARCEAAE